MFGKCSARYRTADKRKAYLIEKVPDDLRCLPDGGVKCNGHSLLVLGPPCVLLQRHDRIPGDLQKIVLSDVLDDS